MSKRDFAEDRRICDAVTQFHDVWKHDNGSVLTFDFDEGERYPLFYGEISPDDARFIAEARTGWPAALDRIAELETELIVKESEYQSALDKVIRAERWAKEVFEKETHLRDDIAELETWAGEIDEMIYEILEDNECSLTTRDIIEKYYEGEEEGGDDDGAVSEIPHVSGR